MRDIDMIVVHCSGSRCDFTTVFRASGPSWGIAICLAFRKPVRVLTPRSSSTSWMLPDPLKLRGLFKSRNPPNLFNKLGRIQAGCALFLCRHISFTQHSTFNTQHSTLNIQHSTFNIQHSPFTTHFHAGLISILSPSRTISPSSS